MKHTFLQLWFLHMLGSISCPPPNLHVHCWIHLCALQVCNDNIDPHPLLIYFLLVLRLDCQPDCLLRHLKEKENFKKKSYQNDYILMIRYAYWYWQLPLQLEKSKRQIRLVAPSLLKCRRKAYCEMPFIPSCKSNLRPHHLFETQTLWFDLDTV